MVLASSAFALEISDFKGGFQGNAGAFPVNWERHFQGTDRSGLTAEYSETTGKLLMYLEAPADRVTTMQTKAIKFPAKGTVTFRFRARSLQGTTRVRLFLIADKYKHTSKKVCNVGEEWTTCSIELGCKEDVARPVFWPRIDLFANGRIVVDNPEIIWEEAEKKLDSGNLVNNGSLSGGAWNYYRYHPNRYSDGMMAQALKNPQFTPEGTVILPNMICFQSMLFPYQPKQTYTLLVRMRNPVPEAKSEANIFFINGAWKMIKTRVKLTSEWKTYALTGMLPSSTRNLAYVRFDPAVGSVEIDRIELRAGTNQDFAPLPECEFYPAGTTVFDAGKEAGFQIRLIQNRTPKAGKLKLTVTDAFKNIIARPVLDYAAKQVQELTIPVAANHPRGVFFVRGEGVELRYAVLRDLSGADLPQNRYAGHYAIYAEQNLELFHKYAPIGENINRFFSPNTVNAMKSPEFQQELAKHPFRNVMRLPYIPEFKHNTACEVTPENLQKLLDQQLSSIQLCKGKLYGLEIFNEPHLWRIRTGPETGKKTMPPEKLAMILKYLHEHLKKAAPQCRIFGPVSGILELEYAERFVKAGGAEYIDAIDFHAYNSDPDLEKYAERVMRLKKIFQDAGRDLPIYNTEAYFGLRNSIVPNNDDETRRIYCKENELEHANISAVFLLNHAAAGVGWCNYMPRYLFSGVLSEKPVFVMPAASALNAAIEFTGDAGAGKVVHLDDSLRCFFFPDAKGGALASLRNLAGGSGIVTLPENVTAFDLFGNRIPGKKVKLADTLVYLRFAPGCDSEKILKTLAFSGIGREFDAQLSLNRKGVSATVRNCRRTTGEAVLSLSGVETTSAVQHLTFAPGEAKKVLFPVANLKINGEETLHLSLKMQGREKTIFHTQDIRPFPAEYAETFRIATGSGISLGKEDTTMAFNGIKWSGVNDLSAKVAAQWNKSGLFFRVEVTDDRFVPGPDLANCWKFDSLQFFFDMRSDATGQSEKERKLRDDDLGYVIAQTSDGKAGAFLSQAEGTRYIGNANATTGVDDAVRVSVNHAGNVTVYEVFFPKEALYQVKFAPGSVIGFALLVNDNDGEGRKAGLTTSSAKSEPYRKAHLFRKLILMEK